MSVNAVRFVSRPGGLGSGAFRRAISALVVVSFTAACGSSAPAGGSSGGGTTGSTTTSGGASGGGGGTRGGGTGPATGGAGVYSGGAQAPTSTGTIAYVQGNELRLIEPDGSGDRLVWTTGDSGISGVTYRVSAPAWRPNGYEIAFSSNHEEAYSVFDRDLYAVRPDGGGLRRLTNAPTREQAATYPKGSVRVTVQNDDVMDTYFFLVLQGAAPKGVDVAPGMQETFTIPDVADLGPGVQQGIAINQGLLRWMGPTVDVKAGQTVDAGIVYIHWNSRIDGYAADEPFWRSDATKVGYRGPYCTVMQVASNPAPGYAYDRMFGIDAFVNECIAEWGPTTATAAQLVLADGSDYADTSTFNLLKITEGATTKPPATYSLDPTIRIQGLHWLPDGSGFVFARRNSALEYDVNLWEYELATGEARQVTNVQFEGVMRRFSMSPDGSRIAFEMVDRLYGDSAYIGYCDLWVMNRDGSGARRLVEGAAYPAWNPLR